MSTKTERWCDGCNNPIEFDSYTKIERYDDVKLDWCVACTRDKFEIIEEVTAVEKTATTRVLTLSKKIDDLQRELEKVRAERAELAHARASHGELHAEISALKTAMCHKADVIGALSHDLAKAQADARDWAEAAAAANRAKVEVLDEESAALYRLAVDLYEFIGFKKRVKYAEQIRIALMEAGLSTSEVDAVLVSS